MTTSGVEVRSTRVRRITFIASNSVLAAMTAGLMLPDIVRALVTEWGGVHFLHEAALVLLASMILIGLAVQLGGPARRPAAMVVTLAFPAVFVGVAIPATAFVFPPLLVMLILAIVAAASHPSPRALLRSHEPRSWPTMALAAAWTIPALGYTVEQFALQRGASPSDPHAESGHWAGMGVFVLTVAVLSVVAGWRPAGWRIPAATASVAAGLLGVASLAYPDLPSSFGLAGGSAAVLWALALGAASFVGPRLSGDAPTVAGRQGAR